jgi:uncharacterized protein (DUF169 family)
MESKALKELQDLGKELHGRLRLKTSPIGIKMLKNEDEIPQGTVRPKKDLGYQLAACQAYALTRRQGLSVVQLLEDMWCSEAVIGFGLSGAPDFFLEGNTRFPQEVETLEAGHIWAQRFPRLDPKKYVGFASAPLETINFTPDVTVIYCDSAQLKMLTGSVIWKHGHGVQSDLVNMGACVYSVVPTMKSGKCNVAVPCGGDRAYAMCQDDEMIFSAPVEELNNLVQALRHLAQYQNRVPIPFVMRPEFPMRETYITLAKMLGMDMEKAKTLEKGKYV